MRILGFVCLLVVASAAPALAAPAVYTQYACKLPNGSPAPLNGFLSETGGVAVVRNDCASGGGWSVTLPETSEPVDASGQLKYPTPAGVAVQRVAYHRVFRNMMGTSGTTRYFFGPSASNTDENCEASNEEGTFCPNDRDVVVDRPTEHRFWVWCYPGGGCHGPAGGDGSVTVDEIAVTYLDEAGPTFSSAPEGDLLSKEAIDGTRTLSFEARDTGGGVYQAALVIDGVELPRVVVDANNGRCAAPFVDSVPCKLVTRGSLNLDTTTLSDGPHNLSVVIYDATATNSATYGPVPLQVLNHPGPSSPGSSTPVVQGSNRTAARVVLTSGSAKAVVRRRFGRSTTLAGRLIDAEGHPLARATLSVFGSTAVPGAQLRPLGTVTTDDTGRLRFTLPAGPSRRIIMQSGTLGVVADFVSRVAAPLRLLPSRPHLRNKQKLVLTAYLLGTEAPSGSAAVAFQVRIGHQWRTFATRSIDRQGRARIEHRFKVTYQALTYRFRAVIVGRRSFPFANATSPPVGVRVN